MKGSFRRTAFLANRLLANPGVRGQTPLLWRRGTPVPAGEAGRWPEGFSLDRPEECDDPCRLFRWRGRAGRTFEGFNPGDRHPACGLVWRVPGRDGLCVPG
ncbi:hypothetical protein G4L39_11710 [Limisphaera ngatamarikiensis]|uniref:Uncharacterized protein n=1 Tax=Limisphaera ngatamarikiensis TaxID=1324935 RepID=A0A6M1RZ64_9BACT|nr:hypothetical protein [Limisphaera ngatamarikiensis]NGO40052.1 hypothetical protein [Limisphaera ngatamarikiensis]